MFIVASSFAQNKKLDWLEGKWTGEGFQPGEGVNHKWSMEIVYKNENLQVRYPSLLCEGHWELIKSGRHKAVFIERIITGTENCVNNLKVEVRRGKKKQLGTISISFIENGKVSSFAMLHP